MEKIFENKIVNCKALANAILDETKKIIDDLPTKPLLKVYQVGDNQESNTYVKNKLNRCKRVGIETRLVKLDEDETDAKNLVYNLMNLIDKDNQNSRITSIMVQLPLPNYVSNVQKDMIINKISMSKDIDGLGKFCSMEYTLPSNYKYLPCTSLGVLALIHEWMKYKNIKDLSGINVVMYGRSNLVNKPLYNFLDKLNATITVYHSKSKHNYKPNADIVISAIPEAKVFKDVECKLFIDVTTVYEDGKLCGSLDTTNVEKIEHYTSVPNGVGQLTTAMLCYKGANAKIK